MFSLSLSLIFRNFRTLLGSFHHSFSPKFQNATLLFLGTFDVAVEVGSRKDQQNERDNCPYKFETDYFPDE
jgi:hypothetical protein